MRVIVNYPTDKESIDLLKERINEFKAILVIESVKSLNVSFDNKKEILEDIIEKLKSDKLNA